MSTNNADPEESNQIINVGQIGQETQNGTGLSENWLSSKDKWFIVGLSGFVALFRYAALTVSCCS